MATYVNDLRLKEIATGDEAGTWGTSTNTNLELIGEALGYGTQDCFSTDADATTTVADGATDPARAMYFKVTSSATLTATRTLTIAPNTISRVMFIENATTGSQSINISQGSGANVTIATGKTVVVYLDGAGSGAAVVDALALVDPGVTDTLAEVLVAGNTTGGTSLVVSSGDDVTFTGASANIVFDSSDSALEFADDAKAKFGTGGDLEIYHNGSNSYIDDAGTGSLVIRSNAVNIGKYTGETMAVFTADGSVQLRYDNSAKFETASTGVDITGDISLTDTSPAITFNDSSVTNLAHKINSSSDNLRLTVDENNVDSGSRIEFFVTTAVDALRLKRDEAVFNEGSADVNFRVESDGASHMLFVDAGNNRVGIGESAPDNPLHVTTSSAGDILTLESTSAGNGVGPSINLYRNSSSPADNDLGPAFYFRGENSAGGQTTYATIYSQFNDVTDGAEDATVHHQISINGTNRSVLSLKNSEVSVNEESQNVDFRVESDAKTHMLFVDAGNDRVGIGGTPSSTLHVQSGTENNVATFTSTDSTAVVMFQDDTGNSQFGTTGSTARISPNSSYAVLEASQSAVVINNASQDTDFRVESDAQSNMLVVDAAENKVGINRTPNISNSKLEVGGADNVPIFNVEASGNTGGIGVGSTGMQFFSGSTKIQTIASDGSTFHDAVTITTGDNTHQLKLISTDADANIGPVLELYRNSASPADDDGLGRIYFYGNNSAGQKIEYGLIRTFVSDVTDATEDSALEIFTYSGGAQSSRFRAAFDETVLNESSKNIDFRVESDGNANMLLVDAGNDQVKVGTSGGMQTNSLLGVRNNGANFEFGHGNNSAGYFGTVGAYGNNGTPYIGFSTSADQNANTFSTFGHKGSLIQGDLYGRMIHYSVDTADATGQTPTERFRVEPTGVVANDASNDQDFRVESNSNTQALLVDGGGDFVALGNTVKNPVSGFTDQHGFGFDALNGDTQISSDSLPLEIGRTSTAGTNGVFIQMRAASNSVGALRNVDSDLVIHTTTSGHSGLRLGNGYVAATDNSGSIQDDGTSLGLSGQRFTNLYLSDSVQNSGKAGSETVFNDGGTTADFRVESSGSTHAIFVDGGNDKVGLFTSAPATALDVRIGGAGTSAATVASGTGAGIFLENNATAEKPYFVSKTHNPGDSTAIGGVKFATSPDGVNYNWAGILAENSTSGNAGRLRFYTSNANSSGDSSTLRASIIENGFMGLGVSTPLVPLHIKSTSTGEQIRLESTDSGGAYGPIFGLHRNSATPGDGDGLGQINFYGEDSASNITTYAGIQAIAADVSNGTEDGRLIVSTIVAGTDRSRIDMLTGGTVFNQDSIDMDFVVESDTNANALRVDASASAVMMGKSDSGDFNTTGMIIRTTGEFIITRNGDVATFNRISTNGDLLRFRRDNSTVGSITVTTSATTYNTTSDRRLKENIVDAPSASEDIDAIQIRSFDWKADGVHQKYGVIAQELESVAPSAVDHGDKEDDPMGVDYSKLVPMLIKEIQSLRARVAQLESN